MEYGKRPLFPKAVIQMFRIVVLRQAANGQKQSLTATLIQSASSCSVVNGGCFGKQIADGSITTEV